MSLVEQELISVWNCLENFKKTELIVEVYSNFLNEIYDIHHIKFFVQTHRVIDQVVNGDASIDANLKKFQVQVDKVVDIVTTVFKTPAAMSIFDQEIPHATLQHSINNLLSNVTISYKAG